MANHHLALDEENGNERFHVVACGQMPLLPVAMEPGQRERPGARRLSSSRALPLHRPSSATQQVSAVVKNESVAAFSMEQAAAIPCSSHRTMKRERWIFCFF